MPTVDELRKRQRTAQEETAAIQSTIKATQNRVEMRKKQFRVLVEDIRALQSELKET